MESCFIGFSSDIKTYTPRHTFFLQTRLFPLSGKILSSNFRIDVGGSEPNFWKIFLGCCLTEKNTKKTVANSKKHINLSKYVKTPYIFDRIFLLSGQAWKLKFIEIFQKTVPEAWEFMRPHWTFQILKPTFSSFYRFIHKS